MTRGAYILEIRRFLILYTVSLGLPEDGCGLQTAVLLLINHNFRQVTISTLDLGCLAKSLDMIPIVMGMIRVTDVFCRGPMERTPFNGNS